MKTRNVNWLLKSKESMMEEVDHIYCESLQKTLTSREVEVLKLLVSGKNNSEIADELVVSIHTAKAHVCSILSKMSVDGRVKAAVRAVRCGIV